MVDFGEKIKSLRLNQHWTQSQLAQKLGMTKSVVSAYETGLRMPSYEVLVEIARIFKVSTDYLLGVEHHDTIDLSGLTHEEIVALQNLVKAMRSRK